MWLRSMVFIGMLSLPLGAAPCLAQNSGPGRNPLFEKITQGQEVWTRSATSEPALLDAFNEIANALGITSGQITREQFIKYMGQHPGKRKDLAAAAGLGVGNRGGPGGNGPNRGAGGSPAEIRFRQLDKNNDGVLDVEEMPELLRNEKDKWDSNNDGFIDLEEFKPFYRARMAHENGEKHGGRGPGTGAGGGPRVIITPPTPQELSKKPTVYRAGKLPKGIPSWFVELDTDEDGQIGLYEWKKSGRPIQEFLDMDRNNDGFLTIDEVMRYLAQNKNSTAKSSGAQAKANGDNRPPGSAAKGSGRN